MRKKYKILSFKGSGTVIPHSLTDVQTTLSEMGHRVFVIDLPAIEDVKLNEIAIMDALVDINPDLVITIDSVGLIPCQYLTFSPKMKVISWFFDDPVPFLQGMDVTLFNSRYHLFSWIVPMKMWLRKWVSAVSTTCHLRLIRKSISP
jgi:hypothetical protein